MTEIKPRLVWIWTRTGRLLLKPVSTLEFTSERVHVPRMTEREQFHSRVIGRLFVLRLRLHTVYSGNGSAYGTFGRSSRLYCSNALARDSLSTRVSLGNAILLFSRLPGRLPNPKFAESLSLAGCCFRKGSIFPMRKPARPSCLASPESIVNAV